MQWSWPTVLTTRPVYDSGVLETQATTLSIHRKIYTDRPSLSNGYRYVAVYSPCAFEAVAGTKSRKSDFKFKPPRGYS